MFLTEGAGFIRPSAALEMNSQRLEMAEGIFGLGVFASAVFEAAAQRGFVSSVAAVCGKRRPRGQVVHLGSPRVTG
jgi:hypothetical protein